MWIPRDKRSQSTIPPVKIAVDFIVGVWSDEYKIFSGVESVMMKKQILKRV